MATIFTHAIIPTSLAVALGCKRVPVRWLMLGILFSILPDFDVLAFKLGIAYSAQLGHRGLTHSLFFAIALTLLGGMIVQALGHRNKNQQVEQSRRIVLAFLFISIISHPLLDMLTNGGLGVAFFWPFSVERIFLPWQVIEVSPIGKSLFSPRGWLVIQSELIKIWLPAITIAVFFYGVRKFLQTSK